MRRTLKDRWDGEHVKALIRSSGLRRKWIAEKIGVEASTLTQILNGRSPSLQTAKLLAQVLKCSEEALLKEEKAS
jgi:transcriptional regulator with XRE-family HTH domain